MQHSRQIKRFQAAIARSQNIADATRIFDQTIAPLGIFAYVLSHMPDRERNLDDVIQVNRWPKSCTRRYTRCGFLDGDPIAAKAIRSRSAFRWLDVDVRHDNFAGRRIMREAVEHGLETGIVSRCSTQMGPSRSCPWRLNIMI